MSELPSISTLNTKADVNKQLSNMRSYMNQLKDATESELNNVTYDMLSGALRKKIDNMEQNISANNSYTSLLAETLSASYVKTEVLDAQIARIDTISANYITASQVAAQYATIGSLTALEARVGSVEANYITANYLTANHLMAGSINGYYVQWQKIACIGSGHYGYLYKNESSKDIVFTLEDKAPTPSYTRLCGFLDGLHVKSFYTLAKDNA